MANWSHIILRTRLNLTGTQVNIITTELVKIPCHYNILFLRSSGKKNAQMYATCISTILKIGRSQISFRNPKI